MMREASAVLSVQLGHEFFAEVHLGLHFRDERTDYCIFLVSKLFEEYQSLVEVELKGMSRNQLRCWRLGRIRAVRQFVEVTGDKPVTEITQADGRVALCRSVGERTSATFTMIKRWTMNFVAPFRYLLSWSCALLLWHFPNAMPH
jgi:hypothetical protein